MAASQGVVIVGGRNVTDNSDLFQCFEAETGEERWAFRQFAPGKVDYGNTPRATPLISEDHVWVAGAFGHIACLRLNDGEVVWKKHQQFEFEAAPMIWGHAGTPLLVEDRLIIHPGGPDSALVALNALTGKVLWETAGNPPGYSSLIVAEVHGRKQIIGYEEKALCGWDFESGKQLWSLIPPFKGDFNVPTPIYYDSKLFVATENNGARVYEFDPAGEIVPEPLMTFEDLAPDSHTPVIANGRLFGVWDGLFCLDWKNDLNPLWVNEEPSFSNYVSLVTDGKHVLATTVKSELILFDANASGPEPVDRLELTTDRTDTYAHPAFLGTDIFVRINKELCCLNLALQE
ncbi:outer membrane biogenesis protein BamB [Polystyrenella longa]|uniref:Outer membrane biogenesis protein BamB n=1 Tax=Polystyrenella longa TaxID=2528007 RepID=A0A518CHD0_9PLAN|nr:outer membrane biogenesis protein BamB [Polystyrenella longa]